MQEKPASFSIKNWSQDDQPREKLLNKGKAALSDAELVAILIGSGNREESAVALCKRILASVDNNLSELGKLSIKQLMDFKGIGEAKAISIAAALELGRRRRGEDALEVGATGLILVHNHPSGTLKPSEADKQITNKLKQASESLDIKVLDHLIVTEKAYFSFADENLL